MKVVVVAAALALAAGACKSTAPDQRVIGGGGGTGGSMPGPDAPSPDGSAGDGGPGTLAGRVCVMSDARDAASCAATGAAGITVELGSASATTADDGTFTISVPPGNDLVWVASRSDLETSVMPFGTVASIPALTQDAYLGLEDGNGVLLSPGQGSLFVRVLQAGVPVTGATAAISPPAQYAPFYDGTTATVWRQDATGAYGMVWIPGAPAGSADVTITPPSGSATTLAGLPVLDGALTFAIAAVP